MLMFNDLALTSIAVKDVAVYAEHGDNAALEAMGGAVCCRVNLTTAEGLELSAPIVAVSVDLVKHFTDSEIEFIIHHEASHAIRGHLMEGLSGLQISLGNEFEADRFAVLKGQASAAAGISVLTKIYHRLKLTMQFSKRLDLWISLHARKRKLQQLVKKGF
jgi:Zn-dependent protease with chaperone function